MERAVGSEIQLQDPGTGHTEGPGTDPTEGPGTDPH